MNYKCKAVEIKAPVGCVNCGRCDAFQAEEKLTLADVSPMIEEGSEDEQQD